METKKKYIKPETEVTIASPSTLCAISAGVDTNPDDAIDAGDVDAKGNNNQWGYYDYNVESHWGNLWDIEDEESK